MHCHPFVVFLFDFRLCTVAVDVEALTFVFLDDGFLDHWIEGAEEGFVADEQVGFAAEMVKHPSHFDRDVACTH